MRLDGPAGWALGPPVPAVGDRGWQTDPGNCHLFGESKSLPDLHRGLGKAKVLGLAFRGLVAGGDRVLEVHARLDTDSGPDLEIDLKVRGALRRVDDRGRGSLPAKAQCPPFVKLVEDRLCQVQMAGQAGMVGVVAQLIVEDSMPAPGAEDFGAINEDAVVAGRDVPIDLHEIAPAAHRETVEVAGPDVMFPRLVKCSGPL